MRAIILAAGLGIDPHDNIPKCLLPIGSTTILNRQISILRWCHVKDITVVIGRQGNCWNKETYEKIKKYVIKVIKNPHNLVTKSCYSLHLALKNINMESVLTIDGDVVFDKEIVRALIDSSYKNLLVSRPALSISEAGGKVILDGNRVMDAGEDIQPKSFPWNIYSGIMKVGGEILDDLKKELPNHKQEHVLNAIGALSKKHKICNLDLDTLKSETQPSFLVGGSYATLKRMVLVRKEDSSAYGMKKLSNEIKWLLTLPIELQQYFPKVIHYDVSPNNVWYETTYYDTPSLRRLLLTSEIEAQKALEILRNLIDFTFSKLYSKVSGKGDATWVYKLHIQRIEGRLLTTIQKSSVFDNIISAKTVNLDGKTYENISPLIREIKTRPKLIELLAPPVISIIHGDLHFQNFLVDLNRKTKYNFILTDPRGELNGSDPCYDLGKLWHSFHGLYDFMHEDLFDVNVRVQGSNLTARLEFEDIPALSEYERIHESFPKWLNEYPPLREDPYWEMRTLFAEAAHFCSVMPFHLRMDNVEKRAIALYLTGVKLLNEFVEKYKIKEWEEDLSWINVNTSEDYLRAIKLLRKQKEATL
jgi:choline kinase